MGNEKLSLAAEAYLYGYPLVYCVQKIIDTVSKPKCPWSAPVNTFGYVKELPGPETDFVSQGSDTLYALAMIDLTHEAQVLHLPGTRNLSYEMQFIDAWTNFFAYLWRRGTCTRDRYYLLAGPDWDEQVPAGLTLLRTPTNVFAIVGRFAATGGDDLAQVRVLQDDTWLTPLSRFPEKVDNSERTFGDWDIAPYDVRVGDDLKFWEQLRAWMKLFPPSAADQAYQAEFEPLGLLADKSPYINPDPALVNTLLAGEAECRVLMEFNLSTRGLVNGWKSVISAVHFNLDHLGIGTLNPAEWKFSNRVTACFYRAVVARVGLWDNQDYEAATHRFHG